MEGASVGLELTKREQVHKQTWVYQVDDGTVFYYKSSSPVRLYVKFDGRGEIDAKMHKEEIKIVGTFENTIYLSTLEQIYFFALIPGYGIALYHQRQRLKDENVNSEGLCSRLRDGKNFVYKAHYTVDVRGVIITASPDKMKGLEFRRSRLGTIIYTSTNSTRPSVRVLCKNAIVVELPHEHVNTFASDSSPFVYFSCYDKTLYILDIEKMEFLQNLSLDHYSIYEIAGIHNDFITLKAKEGNDWYLVTATLPQGYFKRTKPENDEYLVIQELESQIKELEAAQVDWSSEKDEMARKDEQREKEIQHMAEEITATIDGQDVRMGSLQSELEKSRATEKRLQESIDAIKEENKSLRSNSEKMIGTILNLRKTVSDLTHDKEKFRRSNDELHETVEQLVRDNCGITEKLNQQETGCNVDKEKLKSVIATLRGNITELAQMNDHLDEEKTEMSITIAELRAEIADLKHEDDVPPLNEQRGNTITQLQEVLAELKRDESTLLTTDASDLQNSQDSASVRGKPVTDRTLTAPGTTSSRTDPPLSRLDTESSPIKERQTVRSVANIDLSRPVSAPLPPMTAIAPSVNSPTKQPNLALPGLLAEIRAAQNGRIRPVSCPDATAHVNRSPSSSDSAVTPSSAAPPSTTSSNDQLPSRRLLARRPLDVTAALITRRRSSSTTRLDDEQSDVTPTTRASRSRENRRTVAFTNVDMASDTARSSRPRERSATVAVRAKSSDSRQEVQSRSGHAILMAEIQAAQSRFGNRKSDLWDDEERSDTDSTPSQSPPPPPPPAPPLPIDISRESRRQLERSDSSAARARRSASNSDARSNLMAEIESAQGRCNKRRPTGIVDGGGPIPPTTNSSSDGASASSRRSAQRVESADRDRRSTSTPRRDELHAELMAELRGNLVRMRTRSSRSGSVAEAE